MGLKGKELELQIDYTILNEKNLDSIKKQWQGNEPACKTIQKLVTSHLKMWKALIKTQQICEEKLKTSRDNYYYSLGEVRRDRDYYKNLYNELAKEVDI